MARIPVYTQGISARQGLGPGPIGNRPTQIGSGAVLGQLAGDLSEIAGDYQNKLKQKEREDAAAWSAEKLSDARLYWTQQQIDREQNAPAGAKDYAGTLTKDYDSYADNLLQSAPNEEARNYLKERLGSMKAGIVERGMVFEAKSRLQDRVDKVSKGIDQSRIAVDLDPSQFSQALGENMATLNALDIPEQQKVKLRDQASQDLGFASVASRLKSDPYGVAKQLGSKDNGGAMDVAVLNADNRIRLRTAAEAEIKRREAEAKQAAAIGRAEMGYRVQDATAAYMQGLEFDNPPTAAELQSAYGVDRGQKIFQDMTKAQQFGTDVKEYATLPINERAAWLEKHSPVKDGIATEGFAESAQLYGKLVQNAQSMNKQLLDDGAGYAIKYAPEVQRAWQGVLQADDPDTAPAAYQAYAEAVKGEQARLGLPQISVIPESYVSSMAASFKDPANAGPKQIQMIDEMKKNWGQHFPDVFKQVVAQVPDSVKVIGSGVDKDTATILSSIAPLKTEELTKPLLSSDVNLLKQTLQSEMEPFRQTFASQFGGLSTFGSVYNEAYRGALSLVAQGVSPQDAAQNMKNRLTANYQIDGTLRVPNEYDIDTVQEGIHSAVKSIKASDLMLNEIPGVSGQFSDERVQALLNGATVVTNKDETGVYLMHNGGAILNKDGKPVEFGFDELIGLGAIKPKSSARDKGQIGPGFR